MKQHKFFFNLSLICIRSELVYSDLRKLPHAQTLQKLLSSLLLFISKLTTSHINKNIKQQCENASPENTIQLFYQQRLNSCLEIACVSQSVNNESLPASERFRIRELPHPAHSENLDHAVRVQSSLQATRHSLI